ncbi:MAG TPA: outer membrane protein assembly factor BamD, partial [Candidatus Megaira endosymbiont of Hartmannula sinica]|nr:outer membrane protein assembly factor BamD [Candidatus Megaera endosymbiont of Hartmannula sinica]
MKKYFLLTTILFTISSCNKFNNKNNSLPSLTPQDLYQEAINSFEKQDYRKASDEFEKLFFNYPGHNLTIKSELMQAYSLYKAERYVEAEDVIDIFIKLHPRDKYIDYAYYLRANIYYSQINSYDLDNSIMYRAQEGFNDLINRFPYTSTLPQ